MVQNSRVCGLESVSALKRDSHETVCRGISNQLNGRLTKLIPIYFAVSTICITFANSYEKEKILNDDAGPDGDDDSLSGAGECEI